MRISDWSSDVCSSDLARISAPRLDRVRHPAAGHEPLAGSVAATRRRRQLGADECAQLVSPPTDLRLHRSDGNAGFARSEEHTSELQSLMRISYAVFCLKKKTDTIHFLTHEIDELYVIQIYVNDTYN